MSEIALQIYEESLREQHNRNEARRIRTRVTEARKSSHRAGLRWPFELLQNALDAGPRSGRSCVNISVRSEASRIVFEHDGAPFTTTELAALLSGGSSKEFESEITTGRFGTGFLVTHVLSERTSLTALLDVEHSCELFEFTLDRSGDEDAILANIRSCNGAIAAAVPVDNVESLPSATFEYQISDENTLQLGLDSLRQALPYLYMTRPGLGRFELVDADGAVESWAPANAVNEALETGHVQWRAVQVNQANGPSTAMRVFRFSIDPSGPAALLLLKEADTGWEVIPPPPDAPRIYREYPVRDSGFVPIAFVLDGKFGPDQERGRLHMDDDDKRLLHEALAGCVVAVNHAVSQRWQGSHFLARVSRPSAAFDPSDDAEKDWWTTELTGVVEQLVRLPIVDCGFQFLPAIADDGPYADFIVPSLTADSAARQTTIDRMWWLMEAATELYPPRKELASDWSETASRWHSFKIEVNLVNVSDLRSYVCKEVQTIDELLVTGDVMEWLAQFLDVVGECLQDSPTADLAALEGLLPNQYRRLCSPEDLRRDGGIPERLKNVSAEIGRDLRSRLLLGGVIEAGQTLKLTHLERAIEIAIPGVLTSNEVIDELIQHIASSLPEDEKLDEKTRSIATASVRLSEFLWDAHGKAASSWSRQLPFISADDSSVRWTPHRMMMGPVRSWKASAQAFSHAYPRSRVLADFYAGSTDGAVPNITSALVEWGISHPDPIATDTPAELKERRLAAISRQGTDGVVVSGEQLSQIALLQPEVLNRCQEGLDEARALLGLVLCHVAPNDPVWQVERVVTGRKAGESVSVTLCPALWLADLKVRAWVPTVGEDGDTIKMPATAATMKELIDPLWLQNNDAAVRLLSRWFGFDELDLRLMGSDSLRSRRQPLGRHA